MCGLCWLLLRGPAVSLFNWIVDRITRIWSGLVSISDQPETQGRMCHPKKLSESVDANPVADVCFVQKLRILLSFGPVLQR
jgi:hypothetical protein